MARRQISKLVIKAIEDNSEELRSSFGGLNPELLEQIKQAVKSALLSQVDLEARPVLELMVENAFTEAKADLGL